MRNPSKTCATKTVQQLLVRINDALYASTRDTDIYVECTPDNEYGVVHVLCVAHGEIPKAYTVGNSQKLYEVLNEVLFECRFNEFGAWYDLYPELTVC